MPWGEESGRVTPLPANWQTEIRPAILARDGYRCLWAPEGRSVATGYFCAEEATDVDHIGDRDDHSPDNLRSLCATHHGQRTSAQGNAARWQHRRTRPKERHPGLLPED